MASRETARRDGRAWREGAKARQEHSPGQLIAIAFELLVRSSESEHDERAIRMGTETSKSMHRCRGAGGGYRSKAIDEVAPIGNETLAMAPFSAISCLPTIYGLCILQVCCVR
jgi:hypothetical protein